MLFAVFDRSGWLYCRSFHLEAIPDGSVHIAPQPSNGVQGLTIYFTVSNNVWMNMNVTNSAQDQATGPWL